MATDTSALRRRGLAATAALAAGALVVAAAAGPAILPLNWRLGAALAPLDWQVQSAAATRAIAAKDAPGALSSAYRALVANPYNPKALTIIGSARAGAAGTRLLNQSAALGWRDPLTNFRLIDQAVREGDPVVAAQRVDAIGRTLGPDRVGRFADRILLMQGGIDAMAERASHHLGNGWMPEWLATPVRGPQVAAARSAFVARVDDADGPWKRYMILRAGHGLDGGGDPLANYNLWKSTLADPALVQGVIYDGSFSRPLENPALIGEWYANPDGPALVEAGSTAGLQMTTTGAEPGVVLLQVVRAQPLLTLEARWTGSQAFVSATEWSYRCRETTQIGIQRPVAVREGGDWIQRATFALAPACRLAVVQLSLVRPTELSATATLLRVDGR